MPSNYNNFPDPSTIAGGMDSFSNTGSQNPTGPRFDSTVPYDPNDIVAPKIGGNPNVPATIPALTPAKELSQQNMQSHQMLTGAGFIPQGDGSYIHQSQMNAIQQAKQIYPDNAFFGNDSFAQNHPTAARVIGNTALGLAAYNPGEGPQSIGQSIAQAARMGLAPEAYARQTALERNQFVNQQVQRAAGFQKDLSEINKNNATADYTNIYRGQIAQERANTAKAAQQEKEKNDAANLQFKQTHMETLAKQHLDDRQSLSATDRAKLDEQVDKSYSDHPAKIQAEYSKDINATKMDPITGRVVQALQGAERDQRTKLRDDQLADEENLHNKLVEGRKQQDIVSKPAGATPQTHQFSSKAWQAANPNGDVEAAKAAAKSQNYNIVD
jgi:hypothetical protein